MRGGHNFRIFFGSVPLILGACDPEFEVAHESAGLAAAIRPSPEHPRYWEYRGRPVMLLGGSREDNLFQIPDLEEHLDLLAIAGGNYVRNTMSSRDRGNVWPFARDSAGCYDLARLNDVYFERFERLLQLAAERDIIVQVELWDRFDFAREPWLANPYRPSHNCNNAARESGLAGEYPRHPGMNDNPFFRSIPAHGANRSLLTYQHAQIDALLEIAFRYPNVLYTMDNETSATEEWGAYWSRYVQQRAAAVGVEVYTTEMWDDWDLTAPMHRGTLDHPELYAFVEISQNNHQRGDRHWEGLQWVRRYTASQPRPLTNVKIYGAFEGRFGTARDAVERFWRNLLGGAASVRFHRPPAGIGLDRLARAHLRGARMLLAEFDLFRATPDSESGSLAERSEGEAYVSSIPGEQYAVYFPDGGAVRLDLAAAPGRWRLRWLDLPETGYWHVAFSGEPLWRDAGTVNAAGPLVLRAPTAGHWVALLTR